MKIEHTDLFGDTKTIDLKDSYKDGRCWHIDEEPFVIYEHEIIDGKFSNPTHDKALAAYQDFIKMADKLDKYMNETSCVKRLWMFVMWRWL